MTAINEVFHHPDAILNLKVKVDISESKLLFNNQRMAIISKKEKP